MVIPQGSAVIPRIKGSHKRTKEQGFRGIAPNFKLAISVAQGRYVNLNQVRAGAIPTLISPIPTQGLTPP